MENSGAHCFVSPHFDDGILSCGGTVHQLVEAGHSVTVMTMMGGLFEGQLPETPILADLHRRWQAGEDPLRTRQREDVQALRAIGADFVHIPLVDCVYRLVDGRALYPTEESLFGAVHRQDYAGDFLRQVALPAETLTVYLPLGVGQHVDHQIVRDWGLRLLAEERQWAVRFYAEYPYMNAERAIDAALAALPIALVSQPRSLSEADIRAKVAAIAAYESQISTFWRSLPAMEADVRRAATHPRTGDYVERFWRLGA